MKKLKLLLLILAFIEGGAVMCVELCSAKILTPYFGTSIYVWAAVLGVTLTALMSGYYLGGYLSSKWQKKETIFWLMLVGGLLVVLTPLISGFVMPMAINLSIISGAIFSLISFLFLPLLLFGATSPLLINFLTQQAKESGKQSGTVYSISTLGGIITTFAIGFYTLPEFGITNTLMFYGVLIMVYTTFLFVNFRVFKTPIVFLLLFAGMSYNFQHKLPSEVIYHSEGILGDLKVVDRSFFNPKLNREVPYRAMWINNTSQTIMNMENPNESFWDYVDVLTYNLNTYANGDKTLLMGLGGGTLYKSLEQNKYQVDVVEMDQRIVDVAQTYFYIPKDINVTIDDARHYMATTDKKYDVVIYDIFHAETPPAHAMTQEAFKIVQERLNENGVLVINYLGFISGNKGKSARSIYKTLKKVGFNIRLLATPGDESYRNLLFICGKKELNAKQQIIHPMLYEMDIDFSDAIVLKDDNPILEHMYLPASLSWRKDYNEWNTKYLFKQ